jgi:methyl-accepting chemotaxis protein
MNFKTKIWMLPISAALVFFVGCAVSYVVGADTSKTLQKLRVEDYPAQEATAKIERNIEIFRTALQAAANEGDESKLKDVRALADVSLRSVDELAKVEGWASLAKQLRDNTAAYQKAGLDLITTMIAKQDVGDRLTQMQTHMAALDKQVVISKEQAARAVAQAQHGASAGVQQGLWVVIGTCVAALITLALSSKLIVASVWRDLGDEPTQLRQAMRRIASGDLSPEAASAAAGAHPDSVSAALGAMAGRLRQIVGLIRETTDSISTASNEIATGNLDLSNRTEHTAANLQQTASSMQELTGNVSQTAEAAIQARKIVGTASGAAQRGGAIVAQVVTNMNEIHVASRKITDIIAVIDGIAFQTNILALNAAVEAARAGEQGRGFAVVASEVRTLAQRSALAAREIKSLIGVSSEKVESGTRLASDAGTAMGEIVAEVKRVTAVIAEISGATTEQASGIGNVNQSVNLLDQMTQQNSALVEQSAAAASSLREQAQQLANSVAQFRLENAVASAT